MSHSAASSLALALIMCEGFKTICVVPPARLTPGLRRLVLRFWSWNKRSRLYLRSWLYEIYCLVTNFWCWWSYRVVDIAYATFIIIYSFMIGPGHDEQRKRQLHLALSDFGSETRKISHQAAADWNCVIYSSNAGFESSFPWIKYVGILTLGAPLIVAEDALLCRNFVF